ncbi:MAG: hypothetical protein ACPG5U_06520 [Planktomarina sp.]
MIAILRVLCLLAIFSFGYNLTMGWTGSIGEATITSGIKRQLGFSLYVPKVPYEGPEGADREVWYYDVGLDRMFRSYSIGRLENDRTSVLFISTVAFAWWFLLPAALTGWGIRFICKRRAGVTNR